jgi:hypothetical protein
MDLRGSDRPIIPCTIEMPRDDTVTNEEMLYQGGYTCDEPVQVAVFVVHVTSLTRGTSGSVVSSVVATCTWVQLNRTFLPVLLLRLSRRLSLIENRQRGLLECSGW